MSTPKSVIEMAKKQGAKMVDVKFVDTFGTWQHFSCPIRELNLGIFEEAGVEQTGLLGLGRNTGQSEGAGGKRRAEEAERMANHGLSIPVAMP